MASPFGIEARSLPVPRRSRRPKPIGSPLSAPDSSSLNIEAIMANSNSPFGFRWLGLNGGSASATDALITRAVASNDSTAIGKGDPVKNLVTGYVAQWTASTAVSQLAGIFVGCKYYNTALQRVVWSPY